MKGKFHSVIEMVQAISKDKTFVNQVKKAILEKEWNAANQKNRRKCFRCGKIRRVAYIHFVGPAPRGNDHLGLCKECWHVPKGWHPCGCGG